MGGQRVVGVAAYGGSPATRVGAGGMPDLDQVAQRRGRPVRGRLPGMVAVVACKQGDAEDPGLAGHRRPGWFGPWAPGPAGLARPFAVIWSTCAGVTCAGVTCAGVICAGSACRRGPGADVASWAVRRTSAGADSRLAERSDRPLSVAVSRWWSGAGASVCDRAAARVGEGQAPFSVGPGRQTLGDGPGIV